MMFVMFQRTMAGLVAVFTFALVTAVAGAKPTTPKTSKDLRIIMVDVEGRRRRAVRHAAR